MLDLHCLPWYINFFKNEIQSTSYSLAEIASALNSEYPGKFDYWIPVFGPRTQDSKRPFE